jgi:hypothetical protein
VYTVYNRGARLQSNLIIDDNMIIEEGMSGDGHAIEQRQYRIT